LRSDQAPSFESVRAVCAALGVPVVDGLVAAGLVSPSEVGARVVVQTQSVESLNDHVLLGELARRLARAAGGSAIQRSDIAVVWSKGDAPSGRTEGKASVNGA
jgi:hypothetical protein